MTTEIKLRAEQATYEKNRDQLVAKHDGKYVLIHGEQIDGAWETYEDALKAGYEKYGLKPFMVKQVSGTENVFYFMRDIPVCPS